MSKDFVGIATADGKLNWVKGHGEAVMDYLKKHPGEFVRVWFEFCNKKFKKRNAKTAAQLGGYYVLLLPEIHAELVRQGWTRTIKGTIKKSGRVITREVEINKDDAHAEIKRLCALVDTDGKYITLGDMDKFQCITFIDNVFNFAGELEMDVVALKAAMELAKKNRKKDLTNGNE